METVTEQPIKKIEFFRYPQSLPGVAPLTKKPEDSGYEIEKRPERAGLPGQDHVRVTHISEVNIELQLSSVTLAN